jgi:hypothetical protein
MTTPPITIPSLVGRHVHLNKAYNGCLEGTIAEHICRQLFGVYLRRPDGRLYQANGRPIIVDFHRGEFTLPPAGATIRGESG